ncbi:MAG: hypothetical protein Q9169_007929 [Polycauliona sp. 2 TL-2023]
MDKRAPPGIVTAPPGYGAGCRYRKVPYIVRGCDIKQHPACKGFMFRCERGRTRRDITQPLELESLADRGDDVSVSKVLAFKLPSVDVEALKFWEHHNKLRSVTDGQERETEANGKRDEIDTLLQTPSPISNEAFEDTEPTNPLDARSRTHKAHSRPKTPKCGTIMCLLRRGLDALPSKFTLNAPVPGYKYSQKDFTRYAASYCLANHVEWSNCRQALKAHMDVLGWVGGGKRDELPGEEPGINMNDDPHDESLDGRSLPAGFDGELDPLPQFPPPSSPNTLSFPLVTKAPMEMRKLAY